MAAPSATPELDELIDAVFDFGARLRSAVDPEGPGGAKATLDELLHTVTDGNVRESIRHLVDTAQAVSSGTGDRWEVVPAFANALVDFTAQLKSALADGRVTPDEIVAGVTDGQVRDGLRDAVAGVDRVPVELEGLDFMRMMYLVQRVMTKVPQLVR